MIAEVDEWKRVPGNHACLLSFAVFLNSMNAYRALVECGAKHSAWDRSGMRPIHVAVLCGNLDAVRDLINMDGNEGAIDRRKALELYTVREKFIRSQEHFDGMPHGGDDDDDDHDHHEVSEPLGDDAPITMQMDEDHDNDSHGSNPQPWGFDNSANPNSSRDIYRSLTADLGEFDIDENGGGRISDDGSDPENMSDSYNIVALGENDDDIDIGGSEDDDDSLPDLIEMSHDADEEMPDANEETQNSDDAKIASELLTLLQGNLKYALARAERRRKASNQNASVTNSKPAETNGTSREGTQEPSANGQTNGDPMHGLNARPEGPTHVVRGSDGRETHILHMGDVVRVQHMPGSGSAMDDGDEESEGTQFYFQVLQAVFKASNDYQKEFYSANLLHLAARQKQHDMT